MNDASGGNPVLDSRPPWATRWRSKLVNPAKLSALTGLRHTQGCSTGGDMDAVTYQIDPDQPQAWCAQCQLPSATRINVHWASEHGDMWTTVLMWQGQPGPHRDRRRPDGRDNH